MTVFALGVKICVFNMSVTESDLDLKGKNAHNFLTTVRQISWACDHLAEMLLILVNLSATWLIEVKS